MKLTDFTFTTEGQKPFTLGTLSDVDYPPPSADDELNARLALSVLYAAVPKEKRTATLRLAVMELARQCGVDEQIKPLLYAECGG